MAGRVIVVKAALDSEARVWFVESSDIAGLNAEAETLEALIEKLPAIVADLIEEEDGQSLAGGDGDDVPIELIAHASTRVRLSA